jgi:hypothetical protein
LKFQKTVSLKKSIKPGAKLLLKQACFLKLTGSTLILENYVYGLIKKAVNEEAYL